MHILSTGSVYLDINTTLDGAYPTTHPETEYRSDSYETALGGSAVIAPLTLAKLGLSPHFVGAVGSDDFGNLVNEKLSKSGIKTHLIISKAAQTNVGINRTDKTGRTYMDVLGDANAHLTPDTFKAVVDAQFTNLDLLYLGSVFKTPKLLDILIATAQRFKKSGKLVFLDHGRIPANVSAKTIHRIFGELMPYVTHYAPSEQDILAAWGIQELTQFILNIQHNYPQLITTLKMGDKGAILITKDGSLEIPSYDKVDPATKPNFVGAGDKFNAGLIYGVSENFELKHCVEIANKVAYLGITNQSLSKLSVS